jgi:hypothetical protein
LILSLPLAGCAVEAAPDGAGGGEPIADRSAAIEGGYTDPGGRAVLGLAVLGPDGRLARTCSGVLLAPDLVLTAQHCVAYAPKLIDCDSAAFGPVVDPLRVLATASQAMWTSEATWARAREVRTPPGSSAVCGGDLALLVLESPFPSSAAEPVAPRLDRAPEEGELYSAVGFGNTNGIAKDAGVRRRRDGLRVECVGYRCGTSEQVAGSEWRGEAGACSGDSGGPALDQEGRVLGITSRGPAGCDDPIYGGLTVHRTWIAESAVAAAAAAGYAAPPWSVAAAGALIERPGDFDERWASCAGAPRGADPGALPAAVGALAGLVLARRRSKILARARAAVRTFPARIRATCPLRSAPCTTPHDLSPRSSRSSSSRPRSPAAARPTSAATRSRASTTRP